MTRLLMMEGNPRDKREKADRLGVRSSSEVYTASILAHFPTIEIDVINAADEDATIPAGRNYADYDGFVICGSSLHAYDREFAVVNQIEVLRQAAEVGLPILGSCWGLQIAAVAAGGEVAYNPRGREVGFARKIQKTDAGRDHPMLAARPAVFDAPCIHYDEVVRMPEGATLLASNAHSLIQAAVIPLGRSEVWAVQYHPEFDLSQLVQLYTLYAKDMVGQGFFESEEALVGYRNTLAKLADNPEDPGLAWQLGIDADITEDRQRRAEIIAWVESRVLV